MIGEKMLEFRKYGPAPCPEETEPPICVVTYPEACGRPAVGEVWCLSFCQAHGTEAHVAARLEAYEDAGRELDRLTGAVEGAHAVRNPLVYEALKGTTFPSRGIHLDHYDAIRAAYDLDAATTDPDTLAYDYDTEPSDTPHDWHCEARKMVVGFMREAYEAGQPQLLSALEPIREFETAQQVLAYEDVERRWAAPRRAAREERRKRDAERRERPGGAS